MSQVMASWLEISLRAASSRDSAEYSAATPSGCVELTLPASRRRPCVVQDWDDRTVSGQLDGSVWEDTETGRGLDLVGGRSIFPHANGKYGQPAWQQRQAQKWGHTDHEVIKLADGEGVVIENGDIRRIS